MILTFEIFESARNHCKKFLKLCQTSFSGIVHSKLADHLQHYSLGNEFPVAFWDLLHRLTMPSNVFRIITAGIFLQKRYVAEW